MCSKSKQSLELLNKRTNNFYIIEYLKVKINNQALKKSIQCLVLPYYDIIRDQNIIFKNTANLIEINEFETKRFLGNTKIDKSFATCTIKVLS